MSTVDLVHVESEQQGRILPDIITLKHFVNVQAQERAHLALLKVHYANNLPDPPCSSDAFCTCGINAATAVGARRFTSLVKSLQQ